MTMCDRPLYRDEAGHIVLCGKPEGHAGYCYPGRVQAEPAPVPPTLRCPRPIDEETLWGVPPVIWHR